MALLASVRRAFVRSLALLIAAAGAAGWSPFALSFQPQEGWTSHGGSVQNACTKIPNTADCAVFGTAEEAALSELNGLHCHIPLYHALGAQPNDYWRMDGNQSPNCNSYQYANYVRRYFAQTSCPDNSTLSGTECTCNSGAIQVSGPNAAVGPTCHGGKNNGEESCQAASRPAIGNPINPATGNKYQREPIYAGPHGLNFELVYNSHDTLTASFSPRWRGSFDRSIRSEGSNVLVLRQDGKAALYTSSGGGWTSDANVNDTLTELQSGGVRTGWQLYVAQTDELETYDAAGKLLSIQFRSGLTQTLTYSDGTSGPNGGYMLGSNGFQTGYVLPAGYLIRVTDSFGRTLSFSYEVNRYVARLVAGGATYSFGYVKRQLKTVTFPDNRVRTYVYGETAHTAGVSKPYALTGIVDEKGQRFATYKYDAQGRAVSTEHAGTTQQHTIVYNTDGSADVTDPRGETRTFAFQNILGAIKSTAITGSPSPACGAPAQGYDANGNVISRTDWNGNRTDYTYDLARNLETSRTEGLTAGGAGTPETRTITTAWHTTFRLPTQIAEPLRATTFTYDPDGTHCGARGALCTKSIQATSDANGSQGFGATPVGSPRVWTYTYNANGSVLTVDGPRTDVADVTTYTYYANNDATLGKRGNVATIVNAAGQTTQITAYNAHGQPLTIVDPNGVTTTLVYDARQRLTSRTAGGEVTAYEYDANGQLTKVTLPDSSFLSYTYDAAHRLTGMQDNQGNRIAYTLDVMGNRTQDEVFDPVNALAQTRSRVYDNLNRLFRELGAQSQTTEYTYDNQGNVLTVKDPLNRTTSNQYDALNRLRQVTDPALGVTQYAYNGLDALTQVTDPRNLATGYTVDGLGNLTLQSSPDTGNTASTHDAAGNVLTTTDAKGQVTTYAYDALNRVTLITFHDGSKQAYAYDQGANGIGRLSSITETDPANQQTSLTQYTYTPHGRVSSEARTINGVGYTVAYGYDSAGRLSGMTYPSGRTLVYSYDSLGRVSVINTTLGGQTLPVVAGVAYHPFGGVKSYVLGNGQPYTRTYDQDGRISSYTLGAAQYAIGYDAASRIEFISELGNPPNTNTYGYDGLDRLTSAVVPGTPFAYSYDAVGNRLSKTVGSATDTLTYGTTSNRIATLTPASGPPRSFVFDPNGSTTNDGANTYTYDVRGRMVQSTSAIGTTSYQVNALGQRIRKTSTLGDTVFHYDTAGRLIAETTAAGAHKREILYLGDIPVGVIQ